MAERSDEIISLFFAIDSSAITIRERAALIVQVVHKAKNIFMPQSTAAVFKITLFFILLPLLSILFVCYQNLSNEPFRLAINSTSIIEIISNLIRATCNPFRIVHQF